MILFIIWFCLSIPVIYISRNSLLHPGSHGFYRLFSWECILWLLVNNFLYWFKNPFSLNQIFSWVILFFSLFFLIPSVSQLKKKGRQNKSRSDETLYSFEKTTGLVQSGIYKYIRHPMYSSLLFLTWGIGLKNPEIHVIVISVLSTIFLYFTAKTEEREDILYFGENYREYIKHSKMFIPFIY